MFIYLFVTMVIIVQHVNFGIDLREIRYLTQEAIQIS